MVISWNELRRPGGHLLMIGLAEDGSDLWKILRKPDGTFWEVEGLVSWAPTGETLRVDPGPQIQDKRLTQCKEWYYQYQRQLMSEKSGRSTFQPDSFA